MMNRGRPWGPVGSVRLRLVVLLLLSACSEERPIDRVGVNVVDKNIFVDSWYMDRTVIDVDYEGASIGTYPGDRASDFAGGSFTAMPRIRWVIDEDFLYAYRDYELTRGIDGEPVEPGEHLGEPVAAYAIESHFDIQRAYNPLTGEEQNIVEENDLDRPWYERRFMRVDWSKNQLSGYYGQLHDLFEVMGFYTREPADLFVQPASQFPQTWTPQFHFMSCDGPDDTSARCRDADRDYAGDYEFGELYHMSFVTQDLLSPGDVPDPFTGQPVNWCVSVYNDAPNCTAHAVFVRTSFLKTSERRQYVPENWTDTRFDRHGYFRVDQPTYDRSTSADDPAYFATDFLNYNINRHNIWKTWFEESEDGDREPIPYADREVRPIVWYTSAELPAHLVRPSFELTGAWNASLMSTVRNLRGLPDASYPRVACQSSDPEGYCYCTTDADSGANLLPDTDGDGAGDCPGRYDPFLPPEEAESQGATNPYDCYVEVPAGAEPDVSDEGVATQLKDPDYNGWFAAETRGSECVNLLRINACNRQAVADNGGTTDGLECQERGDSRYKLLSFIDQPGTPFLGVATLRTDPVSGEIVVGDANIGGPALDGLRTFALQQYDVIRGELSEQDLYTGEDVRSYLENVERVQLPAPPRIDFSVALEGRRSESQDRAAIDRVMQRAASRIQRLRGAEGRQNTYSHRRYALAGTDLERRLTHNTETLLMAGIERLPEGVGADQLTDSVLDQVSPLRTNAHDLLRDFDAIEEKAGRVNMMMPNEYVDDSVTQFVRDHAGWPRARFEFELNRHFYYHTQLHEVGHCLGLRHQFTGSADRENYFDDYYHISKAIPLPDPAVYDRDGTPGFSAAEQAAYEDAYGAARSRRERAGIDRWMNSSVMEYTANWYERTVDQAGRYDHAAVANGYGGLAEVYDNAANRSADEVDPTTTPRRSVRYYQGGELCREDADCPFSREGSRAVDLLPGNTEAGLTQRCTSHPRDPSLEGVCSNFDDDAQRLTDPRYLPVSYPFCTDERASGGGSVPGTLGLCNRFDEGDSFREIVRNTVESYERMYLWTNFRRYRSGYNIGDYVGSQLVGRRFVILQNIYQNMIFRYVSDPEWRDTEGPFGFYDQFMATADVLNFYGRVLGQPDVGSFRWNDAWQRYQRASPDPDLPGAQLSVPLGMGRYFSSIYQSGLSGISRVERIGTFYDKLFVMQLLAVRGWQPTYTPDIEFMTNFYDVFPLEVQQMFSGMIRDEPEAIAPRVQCAGGPFPTCTDPRLVYMDFYRGDCSSESSASCRPDPVEVTYSSLPVLEGGGSFLLQFYAAIFGLSEFPVYFDTSFANQLFICVEGQGDCFRPATDAVEGVDFVRYVSERYGKSFLAYQVEPTAAVINQTSIGFDLVREARDLSFVLRMLQKYRGDSGGAPFDVNNLTPEEQTRLGEIGYVLPGDAASVGSEEDRVDSRVRELESFFFQLIQLQNEYFSF